MALRVRALRVRALLYIQTTLQEFHFSVIGSKNPLRRLRDSVMMIQVRNKQDGELMLWLLFIGGIESRNDERGWIATRLGGLLERLKTR